MKKIMMMLLFVVESSHGMTLSKIQEILDNPLNLEKDDVGPALEIMRSLKKDEEVETVVTASGYPQASELHISLSSEKTLKKRASFKTHRFHLKVDSNLSSFLKIKNGEVGYSCPFSHAPGGCSRRFRKGEKLRFADHLIMTHLSLEQRKSILTCELCGRKFFSFQKGSRILRTDSFRDHLHTDHKDEISLKDFGIEVNKKFNALLMAAIRCDH
jgi:hypothetical protein